MSNSRGETDKRAPSFWRKLMLALETWDEPYEVELESRIHKLEVEVARLRELEKKRGDFSESGDA
jgi:hypothetical protein